MRHSGPTPWSLPLLFYSSLFLGRLWALDCNQNGIPDEEDVKPVFKLDAPKVLSVGETTSSLLAVDLDGDGDVDLGSADGRLAKLFVLWNEGNGEFDEAVTYSARGPPLSLKAADLNGDGSLDMVMAFSDPGGVSVLLGDGRAGFSFAALFLLEENPAAAAPADLDGDGDTDLALAVSFGLLFLENQGDGSFEVGTKLAAGSNPGDCLALDLNHDGRPDLATANSLHSGLPDNVSIFLNLGGGDFGIARNVSAGEGPLALASGDWDGDGDPDLAALNDGSSDL